VKPQSKRILKSQAHSLKPIVMIGSSGLSEAVHSEIERALNDHELIKVRISHEESAVRKAMSDEISKTNRAELIGAIGHIIILYRKNHNK